jgi:putative transposase
MRQGKWSEEQIIGILKQVEGGRSAVEVCREQGVSQATFYKWKSKYGGLEINEARRLKQLEEENTKLKRLVADLTLDKMALKDALSPTGEARC